MTDPTRRLRALCLTLVVAVAAACGDSNGGGDTTPAAFTVTPGRAPGDGHRAPSRSRRSPWSTPAAGG